MNEKKMVVAADKEYEVILIEGKEYIDTGNDSVEFVPVRREVMAYGRKVVFVEGGRYRNSFGEAEVRHIKAETMVVRYLSVSSSHVAVGTAYEYPIRAQAEAVVKEGMRCEAKMSKMDIQVLKGDGDMFLAGWLAARGSIEVKVKSSVLERFRSDYRRITGEAPDENHVRWQDGGWEAYGMEVVFPMPSAQALAQMRLPDEVRMLEKDTQAEIWSNSYVKGLLRMGMRMGRNDGRVAAIAEKMSNEDRRAFLDGAEAREKTRLAA